MMRHRRHAGFTLVEILATLGVLAIGLSAVVALVLGSANATGVAADRNVATIILSEAIEDIKRNHLITAEVVSLVNSFPDISIPPAPIVPPAPLVTIDDVGLFIETVDAGDGYPNIHVKRYSFAEVRKLEMKSFINPFENPNTKQKETMIWPPSLTSPRYGGPLASSTYSANGTGGAPFRVIYCLVRHPDWVAAGAVNDTPYRGVYVLTLTVNRDLDPGLLPNDVKKRYEQVSDPMTVFLKSTAAF
jgi:prepilin-type N-terminal cleavage/methylation domain-containing protein